MVLCTVVNVVASEARTRIGAAWTKLNRRQNKKKTGRELRNIVNIASCYEKGLKNNVEPVPAVSRRCVERRTFKKKKLKGLEGPSGRLSSKYKVKNKFCFVTLSLTTTIPTHLTYQGRQPSRSRASPLPLPCRLSLLLTCGALANAVSLLPQQPVPLPISRKLKMQPR